MLRSCYWVMFGCWFKGMSAHPFQFLWAKKRGSWGGKNRSDPDNNKWKPVCDRRGCLVSGKVSLWSCSLVPQKVLWVSSPLSEVQWIRAQVAWEGLQGCSVTHNGESSCLWMTLRHHWEPWRLPLCWSLNEGQVSRSSMQSRCLIAVKHGSIHRGGKQFLLPAHTLTSVFQFSSMR